MTENHTSSQKVRRDNEPEDSELTPTIKMIGGPGILTTEILGGMLN